MDRATASGYELRTGRAEGFETWTLVSAEAGLEATFAPGAGMIGCSLRHRGEELLELGGGLAAYAATGATFGIPLLYPWANRLAGFEYEAAGRAVTLARSSPLLQHDQTGLPIHGLLTASPHWAVTEHGADSGGAALAAELDFAAHPDLLEAFPFPHRVRIDLRLEGAELSIRTTVAAGDVPVPVSFGYHPYLRIPGAPRERWEVEVPVHERLELDEHMIPTGRREPVRINPGPLGDRSFDDGYARLDPGRPFVVAGAGRRIELRFDDRFPFAQVYTPPQASFICFEPMTAPTNALQSGEELPIVPPGESFPATWTIRIVAESV
jgi:galactose mutarotase-like enzyme